MPHQKKPRLSDDRSVSADTSTSRLLNVRSASVGDLSSDVLANVLCYLDVKQIMPKRRVCKKWKEAVKKTIVPPTNFRVDSMDNYNALVVMTEALPNLQQIELCGLGLRHKFNDGEDPNEVHAVRTANYTSHDIEIISNFRKLLRLEIELDRAQLNGRYPVLFNFPLLQKLDIQDCPNLKWDLEMLAGMPFLKVLVCYDNDSLTGNINSLGVLKDTLERVYIMNCENVEGNFMDLADFPHLEELNLIGTAVTGDIRDIDENDFSSLEELNLPKGVYGGFGYQLQSISDGPHLIRTLYLFIKQRPALIDIDLWAGELSEDSPDWYGDAGEYGFFPFYIGFVKAGSRIGYRWQTNSSNPCEVNWLDPEPDRESSDYTKYIEELREINSQVNFVNMYKGFHQPPTEEEYHRLWEAFGDD